MKALRVLYAGDGRAGQAADYLLAVLRRMRARARYVPSKQRLPSSALRGVDVLIFSDYGRDRLSRSVEAEALARIRGGTGFLMVGGWGSFSAKYGNWHRSPLAELLPVECLGKDDRTNLPTGALVAPLKDHAVLDSVSWKLPPVVCGLNRTRLKAGSELILAAYPIAARVRPGARPVLSTAKTSYPLLALTRSPAPRVAAFTADIAPHWCGGLVDWGTKRLILPLPQGRSIEVGEDYARFLASLIGWLAQRR